MKKLIYYNYNYNNYYNTVYNNYKRSPNGVKENGVVLNYLGCLQRAREARSASRAARPRSASRRPGRGEPTVRARAPRRATPGRPRFIYLFDLGYSLSNARNKILHKSRILFIIDSD